MMMYEVFTEASRQKDLGLNCPQLIKYKIGKRSQGRSLVRLGRSHVAVDGSGWTQQGGLGLGIVVPATIWFSARDIRHLSGMGKSLCLRYQTLLRWCLLLITGSPSLYIIEFVSNKESRYPREEKNEKEKVI